MIAIYMEDNEIGIEGRNILLGGTNQKLRREPPQGSIFHDEGGIRILLVPVCNHEVMPTAACD